MCCWQVKDSKPAFTLSLVGRWGEKEEKRAPNLRKFWKESNRVCTKKLSNTVFSFSAFGEFYAEYVSTVLLWLWKPGGTLHCVWPTIWLNKGIYNVNKLVRALLAFLFSVWRLPGLAQVVNAVRSNHWLITRCFHEAKRNFFAYWRGRSTGQKVVFGVHLHSKERVS